jgi:hypothetical protein
MQCLPRAQNRAAPLRTLSCIAARFCTPYEVSDAVALKPEDPFGPLPHHVAVEEIEHGLLSRNRLIAGDDGGDDHVALVVESDR